MASYVLAHIQLKYGNAVVERWSEVFSILRTLMEEEGIRLKNAFMTQLGGRFFEVWHLWEVEDAEHMNRARRALRQKEAYHSIHGAFAEVIESESLRYCQSLPYDPNAVSD